MSGKGDKDRTTDRDAYRDNYDSIFRGVVASDDEIRISMLDHLPQWKINQFVIEGLENAKRGVIRENERRDK